RPGDETSSRSKLTPSTANRCVKWFDTRAQSSTSTPLGLSMNTRTRPLLADMSQSTNSYPIGGKVRSRSSSSFTSPNFEKAKKKWAVEPISYLYYGRNYSKKLAGLEGVLSAELR